MSVFLSFSRLSMVSRHMETGGPYACRRRLNKPEALLATFICTVTYSPLGSESKLAGVH